MSGTDTITIEVDGRRLEAKKGQMLIEVTDAAGITVPRFCYHKKLSIAANCRMCLVEVEKAPKPLPACATPVMDGMKVYTRSARALAAQKGTMEFLLINHPLDCPICDQGGECELQDVAMGFGNSVSRYVEAKRVVADRDIGPLIETEMTRCIHCTRCVRFGEEIAGVRELGATGRGENMRIGTYVASTVRHELSANVIDLCPVGALTAKPSRYAARAWEYEQTAGVSPHDGVGANTYVHTRNGAVVRVVPRENEAVNETWIADRDRFAYAGNDSASRVTTPLRRVNGRLEPVRWDDAIPAVADALRAAGEQGAALFGGLVTAEEAYLGQAVLRAAGIVRIDSRLHRTGFVDEAVEPVFAWLGTELAALERVQGALLVGCAPRREAPLVAHRLRKAALRGAAVASIGPERAGLTHPIVAEVAGDAAVQVATLAALARAVSDARGVDLPKVLSERLADWTAVAAGDEQALRERDAAVAAMVAALTRGDGGLDEPPVILFGLAAQMSPALPALRALAAWLARATGARFGYLPANAGCVGAALAGALPHRGVGGAPLSSAAPAWTDWTGASPTTLVLAGVSGAADTASPGVFERLVASASTVIVLASHVDDDLRAHADWVLPLASPFETSGTYANAEGRFQSFRAAARAPGEARPGWKVWRVLGDLLGAAECDGVMSSNDARDRLALRLADLRLDNDVNFHHVRPVVVKAADANDGSLVLQRVASLVHGDVLLRGSAPLQATPAALEERALRVNPAAVAPRSGLPNGRVLDADLRVVGQRETVAAQIVIDDRVPVGAALVTVGTPLNAQLAAAFAEGHEGLARVEIVRLREAAAA